MSNQNAPLTITPIDNGFRLNLRGPVQPQSEFLQAELDRVVKARPKVVELDLIAVESIASAGLGMLVGFRNRILEGGGTIKTVSVHPRVLEVLNLSGLMKIFNVQVAGH